MNTVHAVIIHTAALAVVAFSCNAVLAQTSQARAPQAVAPDQNGQGNAAEPSAGARGAGGTPAADSGVDHARQVETQRFVSEAAHANEAEIADARYALAHSQSPEVQSFARKMIEDHTKTGNQLKQIASSQGYTVPSGLSPKDRAAMQRLEREHGSTFNAAYSRSQDRDHREVIAMFTRAAQNPSIDPQVRDFARMTLPVLQEHPHMANKLVATEAGGNHKAG